MQGNALDITTETRHVDGVVKPVLVICGVLAVIGIGGSFLIANGTDGGMDHLQGKALQQTQDLDVLALAGFSQARLQQSVKLHEGFGQFPADQGGGLIERPHFLFEQRQIVQRVEDEVLAFVGAGMAGDHLGGAADEDLMDVTAHQHLAMAVGDRHRIIIAAVAHQGK